MTPKLLFSEKRFKYLGNPQVYSGHNFNLLLNKELKSVSYTL